MAIEFRPEDDVERREKEQSVAESTIGGFWHCLSRSDRRFDDLRRVVIHIVRAAVLIARQASHPRLLFFLPLSSVFFSSYNAVEKANALSRVALHRSGEQQKMK